MSIEEVENDLQASHRDIAALDQIVQGIEEFVSHPSGEDRSAFKRDLVKWRSLNQSARMLHERIEAKLRELTKEPQDERNEE